MTKKVRSAVQAYSLLLPAFLVTLSMMVYPLLITVNLSFRTGSSMNFAKLASSPLGLKNYIDVFFDPATWNSLALSLMYTIVGTGLGVYHRARHRASPESPEDYAKVDENFDSHPVGHTWRRREHLFPLDARSILWSRQLHHEIGRFYSEESWLVF